MAAEGLRIAETVKNPFSLIEACYGVSMVYLRQGEVQRAIPMLERAMGLCQDWHIPLLCPGQAAALGLAYALDGRVAAGLALVEQGVEQAGRQGQTEASGAHGRLAQRSVSAGWPPGGRAPTRRAGARSRPPVHSNAAHQAWALWLLGESTARQASPEGELAAGHYRQALALAEELGMRPLQAHCQRGLGTLYAAIGQWEQARITLSTAIELYRAMGMTFWLPQTEAALAQAS